MSDAYRDSPKKPVKPGLEPPARRAQREGESPPAVNGDAARSPQVHHSTASVQQRSPAGHGSWVGTFVFLLVVLGIAAGGYFAFRYWQQTHAAGANAAASQPSRPIPVVGVAATRGDLPIYLDGVGTVTALNTVVVRSRVDGQLVQVAFTEGQMVKAGDLLVQIDPRPFQVMVEQAQAQQAKDQAALENAKRDLQRYETAREAVPQQQLDTAASQVSQYESAVKIDQAQIDAAQLQLSYTKITAPITGRVGLRTVDVGNQVHASDMNGLLTITQIQPISVVFTLSQDTLPQVNKALQQNSTPPVLAYDSSLTHKIAEGKLTAVDNQIDVTSGTYKLKATFDNTDNALFPNQMVNVRLLVDTLRDVVLLPTPAIQQSPTATFVDVVKEDGTVDVRNVKQGPSENGMSAVLGGLDAGEMVVTEGVDRLQQGTKVTVPSSDEIEANGTASQSQPERGGRGRGGRGTRGSSTIPAPAASAPADGSGT